MILALLAALYGLIAGVLAAAVLWLMDQVSHLVWSGPDTAAYIFATIMVGGVLIALLRCIHDGQDLAGQLAEFRAPDVRARREAALMASMAIVAVGFGGAIGPEAGILAVAEELSLLVSIRIARTNAARAALIRESIAAGALGGLYASPPAGAMAAQNPGEAPKWQLYLAALTGLFGFVFTLKQFLPERALRISLPGYPDPGDGLDMILAILPAVLGAVIGLLFLTMLPVLKTLLGKCGGLAVQTLIGTLLFAGLAAALPILRFSGHHEFPELLSFGAQSGALALFGLAALKVLALAICLAAGWRGGAAFPLLFAGAAAGGSAVWILPAIPETAAIIAGMTAALTAGLGKPIAAMLIAFLIVGNPAAGPLLIGAAIGWAASRLVPHSNMH